MLKKMRIAKFIANAGFCSRRDAEKLIEVSQVHIMADAEALGYSGIDFLENLSNYDKSEREVWVPTITDPRGADFKAYKNIKQSKNFVDMEKRSIKAFKSLGVMMTDTCINYQVFMPPVLREHLAFGDTGSSIYANSVLLSSCPWRYARRFLHQHPRC